jgi:hypothetical protein
VAARLARRQEDHSRERTALPAARVKREWRRRHATDQANTLQDSGRSAISPT